MAATRVSIALGFIPSGFKKVMGERFTSLGPDDPVGLFFEASYTCGGRGWGRLRSDYRVAR